MTTERKQDDMYINSGYLFNSRIPFKENKKALRVLSAGTYQLFTRPLLPTWRPKGRIDWQLIYIAAGVWCSTRPKKSSTIIFWAKTFHSTGSCILPEGL